ncbi:MAG TPA: AEC family transporter [Polyangiales bacterium]
MNFASLAILLTLLTLGYVCARLSVFADNAAETLNRFVIYVSLPALVLQLVPKLRWEPGLYILVLTPWLLLAVGACLVWLAARACGWSRQVLGALLLCVPLGNTSFLGFPLLTAILGPDSVRLAVLFDQLGSFLIVSTYGLLVLARFSGGQTPSLGVVAQRVLKFPPFLSLAAGLALGWTGWSYPAPVTALLARVGDTLVPLAMFAVGLKLQLRPPRQWGALGFGLAVKLVVLPLVALVLVRLLGTPALPAEVAVLEAGMPTMITAGALAMLAGLAPELAAALVGYGIVLSLATVPAWATLLR